MAVSPRRSPLLPPKAHQRSAAVGSGLLVSYADSVGKFDDRDLYSGLIRLHVLHHACEAPVFGLGMVEELARHGYQISPGTLYPILHGLEKKGYLRSRIERNGKSQRKIYHATAKGR